MATTNDNQFNPMSPQNPATPLTGQPSNTVVPTTPAPAQSPVDQSMPNSNPPLITDTPVKAVIEDEPVAPVSSGVIETPGPDFDQPMQAGVNTPAVSLPVDVSAAVPVTPEPVVNELPTNDMQMPSSLTGSSVEELALSVEPAIPADTSTAMPVETKIEPVLPIEPAMSADTAAMPMDTAMPTNTVMTAESSMPTESVQSASVFTTATTPVDPIQTPPATPAVSDTSSQPDSPILSQDFDFLTQETPAVSPVVPTTEMPQASVMQQEQEMQQPPAMEQPVTTFEAPTLGSEALLAREGLPQVESPMGNMPEAPQMVQEMASPVENKNLNIVDSLPPIPDPAPVPTPSGNKNLVLIIGLVLVVGIILFLAGVLLASGGSLPF
ncbi:MAG: hypothetical protein QY330_01545 [Candidatus Dojkabacteria bacterium]|uniref:Uncharacterized protein n=1 Tax=candidate division WS6 bacterium OLB21 TaxID=1617427 RepID=A0A136KJ44_9BACT|nr:MAG: hypothetical protein UZ20_WS6002000515 [candidate division WS6 bacterium OLB21]WKZ28273.1 MAG: hypothetical protein QY330_01545 [Candidatus Dojkabacteria bacterium]